MKNVYYYETTNGYRKVVVDSKTGHAKLYELNEDTGEYEYVACSLAPAEIEYAKKHAYDMQTCYELNPNQVIHDALVEYEENHYETEDDEWQELVNSLIEKYSQKAEEGEDA